jgi:hypothetical protein
MLRRNQRIFPWKLYPTESSHIDAADGDDNNATNDEGQEDNNDTKLVASTINIEDG